MQGRSTDNYFRESGVAGDIVGADDDQVFAGRKIVNVDEKSFAGRIRDAVHRLDGHPGAGIDRILAAPEGGATILRVDVDFDCRPAAARRAGDPSG